MRLLLPRMSRMLLLSHLEPSETKISSAVIWQPRAWKSWVNLTVLTPAARNETRPNVALNIPGPQAAFLHVNRDTRAPITRNSILAGLHQNANERLGVEVAQRPSVQAARISAYAEQAVVTLVE